jgi:hypothetical protein
VTRTAGFQEDDLQADFPQRDGCPVHALQMQMAIEPKVRCAAAASSVRVALSAKNAGSLRALAYQASPNFVAAT